MSLVCFCQGATVGLDGEAWWWILIVVLGTAQGQPIKGQGYMELTGYAERVPNKL